MSTRLVGLVLLAACFALTAASAAHAAPACPAGEISLDASLLRLRAGTGNGNVGTQGAVVHLPAGVALAPDAEPVAIALEADHQPLLEAELPAGALRALRAGALFAYDEKSGRPGFGRGSRVKLRRTGASYALTVRLQDIDLPDAGVPAHAKLLVKLGDDCFSTVLACNGAAGGNLRCTPERNARLRGRVTAAGAPLAAVMVTAFDDARLESVSVFSQQDGRYAFPPLRPGAWRVRARRIGWEDVVRDAVTLVKHRVATENFAMTIAADSNALQPATAFLARILAQYPDATTRGDFTLSCGNCHQIGGPRFVAPKILDEWEEDVGRMLTFLPPYHAETRPLVLPAILAAVGPNANLPQLPLPAPPSGDALRSVVYEYGLGDATSRPGCHDLELGTDGVLYADSGIRWIDPRTGERGTFPMVSSGHSIERAPDGTMWITQTDTDTLTHLDPKTGQFTYYPLPKIGDDQGSYPHTLRFAPDGKIWFTVTKSNHLARFDPATGEFKYWRLPAADPAETGLSIPVPYGCDVAPDGTIWWTQLFGQRVGRFDPVTETMTAWRPPFYGPRRGHVDQDGIVWVPGYGTGVLGRFDPKIERWKQYALPTGIPGAFGTSELPYALNANRRNGEVWVTGSNSDTLIRFRPASEEFSVFPMPTRGSFTREIEFDPDDNAWTCTSNEPDVAGARGRGKFVKIELPPRDAACGNGRVEPGEDCDDGNDADCDACSNRCTLVTGCGDGTTCGSEQCDDGNADDCDGCSAACTTESGLRCGDGVVNAACGEICDPPAPGACGADCGRVPQCGDGIVDPGEECDDGNDVDCDACTNACLAVSGCGDGAVCGAETCDDGNTDSCDGCSAACETESGQVCGDGVVNASCGEQCDPPGPGDPQCNFLCTFGAPPALGTRHLSFGGSSYSSALGTSVAIASLIGDMDLVGGVPDPSGIAPVTVAGPLYYRGPILGGAFGNICTRVSSCSGIVDCDGGSAVDVDVVQDSAGPGRQGNPVIVSPDLGADGGAGAISLTCQQSVVQTGPGITDCATVAYPADRTAVYTTGTTTGHYLNAAPLIGSATISVSGEPFSCGAWSVENGPGILATTFLFEDDPQAGDTANANVLDD
jgi:cysteine-rich repeat protein